jgi:hypothetical protein
MSKAGEVFWKDLERDLADTLNENEQLRADLDEAQAWREANIETAQRIMLRAQDAEASKVAERAKVQAVLSLIDPAARNGVQFFGTDRWFTERQIRAALGDGDKR